MADQATTQAQSTTPEQCEAQARELGKRAAEGGAAGTGAAAIGLILGAIAAAIGGRVGQRFSFAQTRVEEDDRTDAPATKWPRA